MKHFFPQRRKPFSPAQEWAFVLITLGLLVAAAMIASVATELRNPPVISPVSVEGDITPPIDRVRVPNPEFIPPQVIEPEPIILADARFQTAVEKISFAKKATYHFVGKMPFSQSTSPASGNPTDSFEDLLNAAAQKKITTTPSPAPAPTLRDFSYTVYAEEDSIMGIDSTIPTTGNFLMDLFSTALIQPTAFESDGHLLYCQSNGCGFFDAIAKPTWWSLIPSSMKTKKELNAVPFKFTGTKLMNGFACDWFEFSSAENPAGITHSLCLDSTKGIPIFYSNSGGYELQLKRIELSSVSIEEKLPISFGADSKNAFCASDASIQLAQAHFTIIPFSGAWSNPQLLRMELFSEMQNPILYPSALPTNTFQTNATAVQGATTTVSIPLVNIPSGKYLVRLCDEKACSFVSACQV